MPWNLVESTEFPWIPWKFHGVHENFMDSTKFSWIPWKFHGVHEIFMEPTKFSWTPWKFHGTHENFMGSMKFSWIPWKFSWKIRGKFHGSHERSTKSMESMKNQLDSAPYLSCRYMLITDQLTNWLTDGRGKSIGPCLFSDPKRVTSLASTL